ncbi:MAG: DUF4011 domain-containing protein [Clostridia bacterium]|nr:DUF4011 domain-containing protein [Clostridia bacterium]
MNPIYSKYKERFIQISGSNRSLYLKGIVKKYSYDIGAIMENRNDTDDFISFLWHEKRSFSLINEKVISKIVKQATKTDELMSEVNRLAPVEQEVLATEEVVTVKKPKAEQKPASKIISAQMSNLRYLKREAEEVEKETGLYDLYVGYPFVIGNLSKDIQLKAPLMLFPVHIHIEKDEATLTLSPNQPIMLNKAFILAYSKEHNVRIDKLIQEFDPQSDDIFKNPNDVIDYLISNGFKMRNVRRKTLQTFDSAGNPIDGLEIRNYAVIGKFPLANSIYNDYLSLEKNNLTTPAIDALLAPSSKRETRAERKRKKKASKRQTNLLSPSYYSINDLDYAQENALSIIDRENNVVIYGPPGTGKSQTIVNIISDALCKGKRVLVISQKRAALDVVYSRLGKLNNKAMLIPNPEKDKLAFFERVRTMHSVTLASNYSDNLAKFKKVEGNINQEIEVLQSISDTLFTKTPFGLTLQEMYAGSYNIGKDTKDHKLYKKLIETNIVNSNYVELSENVRLINDKNLAKLFISQLKAIKENEMVSHILPDIDMHQLKEAQTLIDEILSSNIVPFDASKYPYSRYLTTFYLEKGNTDRAGLKKVAHIITNYEHPSLTKCLHLSYFPAFWPMFPFLQAKYNGYYDNIKIDLNVAKQALEDFTNEYKKLNKVLDNEGYSLAIGGLINGNVSLLIKLRDALSNYVKVRDMNNAIQALSSNVREILEFAYFNSEQSLESMQNVLDKIIPIRIYHEIISMDRYIEPFLSKTVTFDDLRNRVLLLKADQREISKSLANSKFSLEYSEYFKNEPRAKDYLYEIQKQRGLRPIRIMFEYFDELLLRLFPCWLLSPEVVSTIFPLKRDLFDLVVFDEASQIFIENALPGIYRGTKIVIAGDNKQLRPTAGFVKKYFGDYSNNYDLSTQAALEVESLLDLATSRYYPVHLQYHYRSQYAELIDFSNAAFYENKLQIAPNTIKDSNEPPITRIKVKGTWQNRHNHEEAVAVVKLVKNILNHRKMNESIGIVTFNIDQKEYIEDLLDSEADKSQTFRKQLFNERNRIVDGENASLFVKNLENVQGDERDIIIFSVGYAKNDYDKVVAQFGPLSNEGGENRLNVAITRAKKKVYVVTSIEPEELDRAETTKNNGPKLLKKYLQYVRAVSENKPQEVKDILSTMHKTNTNIDPIGAYEIQIKEALENLGYEVDINLGNTDYKLSLGVFDRELNTYVLGVECDYRAYHSSTSILERDVYRFKFLESRGWVIVRVWSRDWWLSREKVLADLVANIERQKSLLREKLNNN